jgi:mono/diheme cytochrome c family protein
MSRIGISLFRVMIPVGLALLLVPVLGAKKNPSTGPSGRDIYMDRCGACHGEDAKGSGPAAGALAVVPANLTTLAQRNGGVFPADYVKKVVGDWVEIRAHGSREMPIWGELFHPKSAAGQQAADEQFEKLAAFLKSVQQ